MFAPELEMYAVCGPCFQGDHDHHTEIHDGKRCTCVTCCHSQREREIAARFAPVAVASEPVTAEPPEAKPADDAKRVTLEPMMNVLAGLPLAFGVERIGVPDENGAPQPQVTLRMECAVGGFMFPMSPAEATELANRLFRASTGLHVAR